MNIRRRKTTAVPPVQESRPGPVDWWLLAIILLLLCVGLLAVLTASGPVSQRLYGESYHFFRSQLMAMGLGGVVITIICLLPRKFINKLHYWGVGIAIVLILASLFGPRINGAHRWINLRFMMLQPMEFTRVALVMYLAYFLSTKQHMVQTFSRGLLPPTVVTGIICLLLYFQPDFGGIILMLALFFFMCIAGGLRTKHLLCLIIPAAFAAVILIVIEPYRLARWTAYLEPFADKQGAGWQIVQSLYALGSGGLFGVGIGASRQKTGSLPEAHNDYIMSIVGEETGFFGITIVMVLFALFFYRSYHVVLHQKNLRDKLSAYGLTIIVALSFTISMAVILGLVPPKGIAMPFISYGGSSLLSNMICAGLLLHYSRTSRE